MSQLDTRFDRGQRAFHRRSAVTVDDSHITFQIGNMLIWRQVEFGKERVAHCIGMLAGVENVAWKMAVERGEFYKIRSCAHQMRYLHAAEYITI